jgi:hypothetical protein
MARNLAGRHVARPVNGRLELDLTRRVATIVCDMGAMPDAVAEDALDVVDAEDGEILPGPRALIASRRNDGRRY